jgi:hypothetical protein
VGRVVFLLLKLTYEAKTQTSMLILHSFEAVYISHVLSLEKKGLECTLALGDWGKTVAMNSIKKAPSFLFLLLLVLSYICMFSHNQQEF